MSEKEGGWESERARASTFLSNEFISIDKNATRAQRTPIFYAVNNASHGTSVAKADGRDTIEMILSSYLRFKSISAFPVAFNALQAARQPFRIEWLYSRVVVVVSAGECCINAQGV